MKEVGRILHDLQMDVQFSRFNALPPHTMTTTAVQAFLQGTGSLLYLWDHDEALDLITSVYHPDHQSTQVEKSELFAISAVGSYCDGEANIVPFQKHFMHSFLHILFSSPNITGFRRMRLLTCLAICRFIDSAESARILMSSVLSIGRKELTSPSVTRFSAEKTQYWWKNFRTVLFLESWFAYNTGRESRVTEDDLFVRSRLDLEISALLSSIFIRSILSCVLIMRSIMPLLVLITRKRIYRNKLASWACSLHI